MMRCWVWRETALLKKQKWRTPWPTLSPGYDLLHGSDKLKSWHRQRRMKMRVKADQMKEMRDIRRGNKEKSS